VRCVCWRHQQQHRHNFKKLQHKMCCMYCSCTPAVFSYRMNHMWAQSPSQMD
jgi:hypothetical protein